MLDLIFGPFAVRIVKRLVTPARNPSKNPSSILVIRPGGIGDAVLLVPTIQALKKRYPDAEIDILAEKRNREVFTFCPEIANILTYEKAGDLFSLFRRRYDITIDTEQWYRLSAVVAYLLGSPVRIGFETNIRGELFTDTVGYEENRYEGKSFLNLISSLTGEIGLNWDKPFISVPSAIFEKSKKLLLPLAGRKIAAVFPGGSIPEKLWGAKNFEKLSQRLLNKGYAIMIIGGEKEKKDGDLISKNLAGALNLCGNVSLIETASALKQASLLITGDSGIMHIAFALGVKTLSLFGPGNAKKWAPRGKNYAFISKEIDCSPCTKFGHTSKCRNNMRCMRAIEIEEVYGTVIKMLEG